MLLDPPETTTHLLACVSPSRWFAEGFPLQALRRISIVHVVAAETVEISSLVLGGGFDLLRESPCVLEPGAHDIPLRDLPVLAAPNRLMLEISRGSLVGGHVVGMDAGHPYLDKLPKGYGDTLNGFLVSAKGAYRYAMQPIGSEWSVTPLRDEIFYGVRVYVPSQATIQEIRVDGGANLLVDTGTLGPGWHKLQIKISVLVRPPNRVSLTVAEGEIYAAEAQFKPFPIPQETKNTTPPPEANLDRLGRLEQLLCSALHFDDGVEHGRTHVYPKTGLLYCGLRHPDCWATLFGSGISEDRVAILQRTTQGFLTSLGRFVDREEGLAVARAAGQVGELLGGELTSEDLW